LTVLRQRFENALMEKSDVETKHTALEEKLRENSKRDFVAKLQLKVLSDKIENARIPLRSPEFLAARPLSDIRALKSDLKALRKEEEAVQKEIDDLKEERKRVNEQLNELINPYHGLQKTPGESG
jgi:chromosome segregation ATPase